MHGFVGSGRGGSSSRMAPPLCRRISPAIIKGLPRPLRGIQQQPQSGYPAVPVGSMDVRRWRVDDGQHMSAITFSADHPGSSLSIGPGSSTSAINVLAVNVNLPNDSVSNGNEAVKVVNRGLKATRVIGLFDHPLFPMAPVSLAMHTKGF